MKSIAALLLVNTAAFAQVPPGLDLKNMKPVPPGTTSVTVDMIDKDGNKVGTATYTADRHIVLRGNDGAVGATIVVGPDGKTAEVYDANGKRIQ